MPPLPRYGSGEFRRDAFRVAVAQRSSLVLTERDNRWPASLGAETERWQVEVVHRTEHSPGTAYRVIVAGSPLAPSFLSCADSSPKAEIRYEAVSFTRIR